ncbi:unnamed protein product [Meganyctiphanes norvegica]|uniref:C-type lectin domain-containing protein n=1 Tax=Meganyctiphanes norvegica TaxID=48144 RepID=A0AAV2R6Y1_MEGNR
MILLLYIFTFIAIPKCGSNSLPEDILLPKKGEKMGFKKSFQRCSDMGMSPFIPKTSEDWAAIAEARNKIEQSAIWIPATDKRQEGILRWTDGKLVNLSMIPSHDGRQLIGNAEGQDCMVLRTNGKVYMAECSRQRLPVICVPKKARTTHSVSIVTVTPSSAPTLKTSSINTNAATVATTASLYSSPTYNRSSIIVTTDTATITATPSSAPNRNRSSINTTTGTDKVTAITSSVPSLNRSSIITTASTAANTTTPSSASTLNGSSIVTTTNTSIDLEYTTTHSTTSMTAITNDTQKGSPKTNRGRSLRDFETGTQTPNLTTISTLCKAGLLRKREGPTWGMMYLLIAIIIVLLFAFFVICVGVIAYTLGRRKKEKGVDQMSLNTVSSQEHRRNQRPSISSHVYEEIGPPVGPPPRISILPSLSTSDQDSNSTRSSVFIDGALNLPFSPRRVISQPPVNPPIPSFPSVLPHLTGLQNRSSVLSSNLGPSVLPQFSSIQFRPRSKSCIGCETNLMEKPIRNQVLENGTDSHGATNRAVSLDGIVEDGAICPQGDVVDGTYVPMGLTTNKETDSSSKSC